MKNTLKVCFLVILIKNFKTLGSLVEYLAIGFKSDPKLSLTSYASRQQLFYHFLI